jgi:tRNA A37 methylthiotransferase MiaB
MKKVYIYTDGCECRLLDAKKISDYLKKNKYLIVESPDKSDLIIYVTCAFLNEAKEMFLKKIEEFKKYKTEVIVAGCLPEIDKDALDTVFDGKIISTKNLDKIDSLFPENKVKFSEIDDANFLHENIDQKTLFGSVKNIVRKSKLLDKIAVKIKGLFLRSFFGSNSLILETYYVSYSKKPLFHIRISWGCLGNCAYCAIKRAIGEHKSKPVDECIKEFKKGLTEGYKQFIIEADDSGAYGFDNGSTLPELLKQFVLITGEYTIAIRNLHPRWVVKYIDELEEIVKSKKIVSMDIPIQSNSSRILKLMNRYSDTKKVKNALNRLQNAHPDLKINSCYILGFPSETEEEFYETIDFIKKMKVNGYVFPFSCKKGSIAEKMEPKISKKIISKRMKYAKKMLKNGGYTALFTSRAHFLLFEKAK